MVFLFGTYPFSLIYQSRELLACSDNHQDLIFRQKKGLQKNLDKLNWPIRQFKTRIHAFTKTYRFGRTSASGGKGKKPNGHQCLQRTVRYINAKHFSRKSTSRKNLLGHPTAGMEFIALDDIVACKADGSYTCFMLQDESMLLVSKHLKEYEMLLSEHNFMRVHNSFLINLKKVKKYVKSDGGHLIMSSDMQVNISPRKRDDLIEAMKRL